MSRVVYLDYAAATPVDSEVLGLMQKYYSESFYNASSMYLGAKGVRSDIENARLKITRLMGVKPTELIMTSGATEANNLAIKGVTSGLPDGEVVVSGVEHPAVSAVVSGHKLKVVRVDEKGVVDIDDLRTRITDKTCLVSVMYANNEVGTLQPISKIAALIKDVRQDRQSRNVARRIYLHSDASQAVNYRNIDVARLGVDLLTISSAKIYGPKGVGALYVDKEVTLAPQLMGGGQEFGVRSGTENTPAIIGFAGAFEMTQSSCKAEAARVGKLRNALNVQLVEAFGDKIIVNTPLKISLPNFLNVSFLGQDGERLLMELDEQGIMVSTGSACSASDSLGSKTLSAMGAGPSVIDSSIRFSLGRQTKSEDIDYTLTALKSIINT